MPWRRGKVAGEILRSSTRPLTVRLPLTSKFSSILILFWNLRSSSTVRYFLISRPDKDVVLIGWLLSIQAALFWEKELGCRFLWWPAGKYQHRWVTTKWHRLVFLTVPVKNARKIRESMRLGLRATSFLEQVTLHRDVQNSMHILISSYNKGGEAGMFLEVGVIHVIQH